MKLREALEIVQSPRPEGAEVARYVLACSSTPAHLQTFFRASLMQRTVADVQISPTTYGDLLGSLERLSPGENAGVAVVCEWYDLDPRLGYRRLGGWAPRIFDDIVATVESSFGRLQSAIDRLSEAVPVAVALPTLSLPPLEIAIPAQALDLETRLWRMAWDFAEWCVGRKGVRLVSPAELDRVSPAAERFELRTELSEGSPYKLAHAAAMGKMLAQVLAPSAPFKGLITDLDDTLWHGIVGEVGVAGVNFTLENHAQIHGLYQQFLQSLAERGVLVGVASKNDATLVEETLGRDDLLVQRDSLFPVEAHWQPKSESVERILQTWNIGEDAVVFIDDSPMELAEVQSKFPQMRCLQFPTNDPAKLPPFFHELRETFGKAAIREEDWLRAQSLRQNADIVAAATSGGSQDEFLAGLDARVTFQMSRDASDERAFELINKTNQFNLNGRRVSEAGWKQMLLAPDSFLVTTNYADKFGPLGKIAVLLGEQRNGTAALSSWVMSCRAFSRRIEHATLRYLFEQLGVEKIELGFLATDRNGPLREFLASLEIAEATPVISRDEFFSKCPAIPHKVEELATHG